MWWVERCSPDGVWRRCGELELRDTSLGANAELYNQNTWRFLDLKDIWSGLIKAAVFGLLLTLTGCTKGYYTSGGAEGVGRSTTSAVVVASLIILLSDFFLTKILF